MYLAFLSFAASTIIFTRRLAVLAILGALALPLHAQSQDPVIDEMEARFAKAIAGDWVALDSLLAEEFVYNTAAGTSLPKAQFLTLMRLGTTAVLATERQQTDVFRRGEVAWVSGLWRVQAKVSGEDRVIRSRHLHVWVQEAGQWQLAARQVMILSTVP